MILLLGSTGQVGRALMARLGYSADAVHAPARAEADLARPEGLRNMVRRFRPTVVINAAAYTAVDRAESEPELARVINGVAPGVLAEEVVRLGSLLIHFSTDYVFDGAADRPYVESDATRPVSAYGRSKLDGELAIAAAGGRYFILRTGWVYGLSGVNFLLTMRRLFREREEVRVVNDQFGAPTAAAFLAEATLAVLDAAARPPSGTYHVAAAGQTSWHGFAERIHGLLAARETLRCRRVVPITTAEYPTPAKRPRWSVLDTSKFRRAFRCEPSSWQQQLEQVIAALD